MPMRPIWASLIILITLLTIASCCCEEDSLRRLPPAPRDAEDGADVVVIGRIRTLDPRQPEVSGLVIRGGVVARLTSADAAIRYASSRTRLVTVPPDGVALPGFIESHAHFRSLGRSLRQIDLRGTRSADEAAAKIAEAAKGAPADTWVLGRGWNQQDWAGADWPNRIQLDQAAPGLPVALTRVDGHAVWVSTRALELARIDRTTPDPLGGEILKDQAGEPTGILIDRAMDFIDKLVAVTTTDHDAREDFLAAQAEAFRNGITTFVDCGESAEKLVLLTSLYDDGTMKLRIYAMLSCSDSADLASIVSRPPVPSMFGDRLAVRAVKIYADGALGSRGAWLLEPYSDRPGHYGFPVSDPTFIRAAVRGCLDSGYQLCIHAIGDRANREVLDAIQAELDKTPAPDHRFRIEHAQCIDPTDLQRFRREGVIPSIQPCHATSDAAMACERLGTERAYRIGYQYRAMVEEWLHPAIGTDAPVERLSPIENFYSAVVRKDAAGRLVEPFQPEQRLNRLETLLGMTEYGAYAAFCEERRGKLMPGYAGDVVVLDHDLLTCHPEMIQKTAVMATIVAGEVVYQAVGSPRVISNVGSGNLPGR